jgi:hypothetical protein
LGPNEQDQCHSKIFGKGPEKVKEEEQTKATPPSMRDEIDENSLGESTISEKNHCNNRCKRAVRYGELTF